MQLPLTQFLFPVHALTDFSYIQHITTYKLPVKELIVSRG